MKLRNLLALMLIGSCSYVYAQSRNTPADAGSLRGKRITNPLSPLDRQGLGWDSANQRWQPTSYATQGGNTNYCAPTSASTTTYTCNLTPALSSYGSGGLVINIKPDVTNTGASTLNVNSLGAKEIRKLSSGSLVAVAAGDLDSDYVYLLRYNGTYLLIEASGCADCVTTAATLTSGLPVIGAGGNTVGIGTRSGNTTEYGTISGAKTASKQATFDASGNIVASAYDVGSANNALTVTRTSGTLLDFSAIAANAVAIGSYSCPAISSSSFSVSSGTGTLWIAVDENCDLVVRHNVVGSCTGCTAVGSSSGFEPGDVPLYLWVVTSDVLAGSGTNLQTGLRGVAIAQGSNMTVTVNNGVYTLASTATGGGYALKYGGGTAGSPADATTYYFGNTVASIVTWLTGAVPYYYEGAKIAVPKTGTVKKVSWDMGASSGGTFTSESITLSLCVVNAAAGSLSGEVCTQLTNSMVWTGTDQYGAHGVITASISVTEGDRILIKMLTPTWVTQAINIDFQGYIYIE